MGKFPMGYEHNSSGLAEPTHVFSHRTEHAETEGGSGTPSVSPNQVGS
jgi:hypothetical protein